MMKSIKIITTICCLGFMFGTAAPLYASVTLNISANNPSSYSQQVIPVKTYLPHGILPEHVIDAGGLDIDFDEERKQTYVHKNITLKPQEAATYTVEIEDIWLFPEAQLNQLRDKAQQIAGQLAESDYAEK